MPLLARLTNLFPLWILLGAAIALVRPEIFTWFSGHLITVGLGCIMLGMGLTLEVEDFRRVLVAPRPILLGVLLQYTIMPALGWMFAELFQLPPLLAVGLILVACCPGGTASNVIAYLARGDVPLSVTMTTLSTFAAVAMTPLLTTLLAGSRVEVNAWGLFWSAVQVIVLPVALGLAARRFAPGTVRRVLPAAPLLAVIFIVLIVSSIVGAGRDRILGSGLQLIGAVFSLHACGFLLGYLVTRLTARDEITARTISIEVGMQNSGLGAVLARNNFADPVVAVPSAISSVFHSLIGSALAALWSRRITKESHFSHQAAKTLR
jgi:bile acid:Na+ symporter, BASS family